MATPRERALSLLHAQLDRWPLGVEPRPERGADLEGRVAGTVGALVRVGLLSAEEAPLWRKRLSASERAAPVAAAPVRAQAARALGGLLDRVPSDGQIGDRDYHRFEGALEALSEVGAADYDEWDAHLRERLGRPSEQEELAEMRELNAGGTEQELLAVIAGPAEVVDGVRILYALRFADGISFVGRREPPAEEIENPADAGDFLDFGLRDDLGTGYFPAGGGGGDDDLHVSFSTAPPADASWVELLTAAGGAIRLKL